MIQSYGNHKVTNASIEDAVVDSMLQGEKVSVLYSDPPWGDGNLKYWVTMNKKMNGDHVKFTPLTYDQLINRIFELVTRYVDGHVFIETGPAWSEMLAAEFKKRGLFNVKTFILKYRAGDKMLRCDLIYGSTKPSIDFTYDPSGQYGQALVTNVLASIKQEGAIVLDPCCGMGYTAQAAIKNGMHFRGNEFNAKRLQKTIARLTK